MSTHPSSVTAFAPATVANVGPGFDVFGFALERPGDVVEAVRTHLKGVRLAAITGDDGRLPRDPDRNIVGAVAQRMLRGTGTRFGVNLFLRKGMALGSGLGSSAASAVAAAVAVNALLGGTYGEEELLDFARYGEQVACGAAHLDNVAPALMGGFTVVVRQDPPEVVRLDVPRAWRAVVVHPRIELPTRKARAALPKQVGLGDMTRNVAGAAGLIAAIARKDLSALGRALMRDAVVVPTRAKLIPGFDAVAKAAVGAGAAGVSISGAGPSMFALTDSEARATVIGAKMAAAWRRQGIAADTVVSRVGAPGARVIAKEK